MHSVMPYTSHGRHVEPSVWKMSESYLRETEGQRGVRNRRTELRRIIARRIARRGARLVVEANDERRVRFRDRRDVADDVDGDAVDRRQEELEVGPRDELGEHAARLLVQQPAQLGLVALEAARHVAEVPHL